MDTFDGPTTPIGDCLISIESFKCDHCRFETSAEDILEKHKLLDCNAGSNLDFMKVTSICCWCDLETMSKLYLTMHLRNPCKANAYMNKPENRTKPSSTKRYQRHNGSHKTKEKPLNKTKIEHPTNSDRIQLYPCDKCSYVARRKFYLKTHTVAKHTDSDSIMWFQCDKCLYRAKRKGDLERHKIARHTDFDRIKWYQCDQCSFKAKQKGGLKTHTIMKHTDNIQWYECDQCPYKAKRKDLLKKHKIAKHTDDSIQWHPCDQCNYNTRQKRLLDRHKTKEHCFWFVVSM